ncbi:MAG: ribonucleoside-diphosphate reductase subunit alpha [Clostridia bacterium]
MQIKKRDGSVVLFIDDKIKNAILKAELPNEKISNIDEILDAIKSQLSPEDMTVEKIQDIVEMTLMKFSYYNIAKSYILYREYRNKERAKLNEIADCFDDKSIIYDTLLKIKKDFREEKYSLSIVCEKFKLFQKSNQNDDELFNTLLKATVELISQEAPDFEFISARILLAKHKKNLKTALAEQNFADYYEKLVYLTEQGHYGKYILENYSKEDILLAHSFVDDNKDLLFNYSGLELVIARYLIKDYSGQIVEDIGEMFLGIALHLAMNEKIERMRKVRDFYELLSSLKITVATPTLSNARKPFHQLSSCFIDTVYDSLDGIYRSVDNFAKVSKFGGGMGVYFGKVRAMGSSIRGYKGAAGGVIRWVKLMNDTAVAVDQLGVRQGSVAVYLDIWHKDLPEFLGLRTNNGDDRMKAHDVFPALCFPDLFWKLAKSDINATWNLMCPHEIKTVMGYSLEDSFGDEWERKYNDCIKNPKISKRTMQVKEIVRLIIKSAVETGTPFIFNRDIVNRANPNKHKGIIYCSNLCTEIAQNMSPSEFIEQEVVDENGDKVVVSRVKAGDFVVCNLASLTLGRINVADESELEHIVKTTVRMLDNVIDLNFYPVPYAKITNQKYRAIGLGTSGYHHLLAVNKIQFESNKHLEFMDNLYEKINFFAIKASNEIAIEKGKYEVFEGSEWDSGKYFDRRSYNDKKWSELRKSVHENGLRNGYLLAVAPTGSTSIISGTSAGIDPIMNKYFLEEKKQWLIPRIAPSLSQETYWYYKSAHLIDQHWSIKASGVRQRHIDQAQSMNLYITTDFTFRKILDLYISAYENGVKSIYYIRSKSLEIDDCESCSS